MTRKTWQEKLKDRPSCPRVVRLERGFPCHNSVHKMGAGVGDEIVLVNPSQVVAIMKRIRKERLTTIIDICRQVARNHDVKACCSLTAGIFIMTAANAAEEAAILFRGSGELIVKLCERALQYDGRGCPSFLRETADIEEEAYRLLLEPE